MAGNAISEKHILQLRTGTDIVNDQPSFTVRRNVGGHNPDVWQITGQHPGHQVPGPIGVAAIGNRPFFSVAGQKYLQVRHPAMVDVRVRPFEAPDALRRIGRKMPGHVLVHRLLQIDAERAITADDEIGTHAQVGRDIPVGIGDFEVGPVVGDLVPGSFEGGTGQGCVKRLGPGRTVAGDADHDRQGYLD